MCKKVCILSFCLMLTMSTVGCKEKEVVEEEPYYTVCASEPTGDGSVQDTVFQYIKYLQEDDVDSAYAMIVAESDLFTQGMFLQTGIQEEIKSVAEKTLYLADFGSSSVTLMYGYKSGEAMTEPTKKELKQGVQPAYLGDYVTDTTVITIEYVQNEDGTYAISLPQSKFSDKTIALKVAKGVRVYVGDVLLDNRMRDDYDFYLISGFLAMDTLKVRLETDVEVKDITLDLRSQPEPISYTDSNGEIQYDYSNQITKENETTHPEGYEAYDYSIWNCFRQTEEDACEWLKKGLQVAYTSYQKQQKDIYSSDLAQLISSHANIETIKPNYAKFIDNYQTARNRRYADCTIIDVKPVEEDIMTRREQFNRMIDGSTMQIYVDVAFSYFVEIVDTETGVVTDKRIHSGTIENIAIDLTQDDGKWRFVNIPKKFFSDLC